MYSPSGWLVNSRRTHSRSSAVQRHASGADAFLAGQQDFSAANPWFSARRLNGVTHFPALEIPDATAAEIERFLG